MVDTHLDGTPVVTGDYEDDLLIDVGYTKDGTGVWQPPYEAPDPGHHWTEYRSAPYVFALTPPLIVGIVLLVGALPGLIAPLLITVVGFAGLVHMAVFTPGRVRNPPPKPRQIKPPPPIPSAKPKLPPVRDNGPGAGAIKRIERVVDDRDDIGLAHDPRDPDSDYEPPDVGHEPESSIVLLPGFKLAGCRCEQVDISAIEDPPGTHFITITCAQCLKARRQTG